MIRFTPHPHSYQSIDPAHSYDWIGITSLVHAFQPPFDPVAQSIKASRNSKSKWGGMDPGHIRDIWKKESDRSLSMGSWYHDKTETAILSSSHHDNLTVIKPITAGKDRLAPDQHLENNTLYPEHLVYLQSHGICGQTDRVDVTNHHINIRDYKTSKVIKTEGFTNWEGISARMLEPLSHLDECNFVHYSLQMSLYLYMVLKHNPQFLPGKLTLEHVIFEQDSLDEYGYPVYKKDVNGDPVIKEVKPYSIAYLKSEVISILNFLNENRELIKQRIENNKRHDGKDNTSADKL